MIQTRQRMTTAMMLSLLATIFTLAGCGSLRDPKPNEPDFAPITPAMMQPPPNKTGSIYQAGYSMSLYEDNQARRVGDVLTVKLMEKTNASKKADTNVTKSNDTEITSPKILGSAVSFAAPAALPLASHVGNNLGFGLNSNNTFKGTGNSDQSNQLQGDITVTVAQVLPNNNLVIRGEKWLTLNQGSEFIRLSGIVRPQDIDNTNTVLSTKIANAKIVYSGTGELNDANKMGWLARFFNSGWWLF